MTVNVDRILKLDACAIAGMSDAEMAEMARNLLEIQEEDRKQNQLLFYRPASERAAAVHKSQARIIGVGGGNGCLPLDAPVLMADASWKMLKDIEIDDVVMGADPDTGVASPSRVLKTWRSGRKPVYRVAFSDGGSFEATAEHMVPMYLGSGRKTTKGNAKAAHKRRLGDYIEPIMRRGDKNPSKRISCVSPGEMRFAPIVGELPLAPYTLGALLGDGSLSAPYRLHNISGAIVERVRTELRPLGVSLVDYKSGDWGLTNAGQEGASQKFGRHPNRAGIALRALGIEGTNSYTKFIPRAAFSMSREWRMQLLAGLLDTDGSENEFSSCSQRLIDDFCLLVRSLGGKATVSTRIARCQNGGESVSHRAYWRLNERPPLCLEYKFSPSQIGKEIDYRRRVCRTAELSRVTETGDITIDHPAHCYITRDYTIVSNSGKSEVVLSEICALATGVLPNFSREDFRLKFRGPVSVRIVVESLTTVLEQVFFPKLQWWKWTGVGEPGSEKGHWGWIPKMCLIDGQWDKSWKEKTRTLRVLCRDPENPDRVMGESTFQFNCLRGDQRVRMADATWKEIRHVVVGDLVAHPSGLPTQVKEIFKYDDAPLTRVRCRGGREIVATPNHRHPLKDGRIVTTDCLKLGDVIASNRDMNAAGNDEMPLWELGWLALMIGDGYIKGLQACLSATPPSRVLNDLPPLPPGTKLWTPKCRNNELRVTLIGARRDNPLIMALKRHGLWGLGSLDKFVPKPVFGQSPAQRAYFLRHLWNTDGTVNLKGRQAVYNTSSRRLGYDVKYLLWSLGIDASIGDVKAMTPKGRPVAAFHVVISGGSFDRFQAAMAGNDFAAVPVKTMGKERGTVTSIEDAGHEAVYCIEVDAQDHLFVVDGLATHNSHDQDPSDFASGDFHHVMLDEPPRLAIWRENEARTMRVKGRLYLAMTWPDDPSIPVDWIHDEIYDKGSPGPNKIKDIDWFELWTVDNTNLDHESVKTQMGAWSVETKNVRIYGRPIRFSNRIHPLFTDAPLTWSFPAGRVIVPEDGKCPETGSGDIVQFCHVEDIQPSHAWPTVFLLDPHPRKPHMFLWAQVNPNDDIQIIDEGELDADPADFRAHIFQIEESYGMRIADRLIDPNMGRSPASAIRGVTWQDEFQNVGLNFALADDSDVGRGRLNEYLRPDSRTLRPRIVISSRCTRTIFQLKRYVWDNYRRQDERDLKQTPKAKNDDFPTLLKYLMNMDPRFDLLHMGAPTVRYGRSMEARARVRA